MPAMPVAAMRLQVSGLVTDNGALMRLRRLSAGTTADGRRSGAYVSAATFTGWLQVYDGNARNAAPGILAQATHYLMTPYGFAGVSEKSDRIKPAAEVFEYDVLADMVLDTHHEIYLRRVERT